MLWITLIWLWNGANLSIYEHVTHFAPNIPQSLLLLERKGPRLEYLYS